MKLTHHDLEFVLKDEWWAEAGMTGFKAIEPAYRVDRDAYPNAQEINMADVGPVRRAPGVSIFNDNEETSARERVVSILCGFRSGAAIPPVEVVEPAAGYGYRYKLVAGTHRFYCALAAGFTHVPTVRGFDWEDLDRGDQRTGF
jgi:hypothetical protein